MGHSLLSPSAGHRWTACPGAPQYEAQFPDTSSEPADEGTALHEVTERCILTRAPVDSFLGQTIKVPPPKGSDEIGREFLMDQDRLSLVEEELASFYSFYDPRLHDLHVELKLKTKLIPRSGGTADILANEVMALTHVLDHKYGRREVSPFDNVQFRTYGFIAQENFPLGQEEFILHVGQPRINNFDCEVISAAELKEWGYDFLIPAAKLAVSDNPPRVAGDHCMWCKAAHVCPELRQHNNKTAMMDFEGVEGLRTVELSDELLGSIMDRLPALDTWIKGIRASAFERAKSGRPPAGWKLVAGKTQRRWKSTSSAAKVLMERYGNNEIYAPGKLLGIPAFETKIKKEFKPGVERDAAMAKLAKLWLKPEGFTIVKEDDKRLAISPAAKDFEDY